VKRDRSSARRPSRIGILRSRPGRQLLGQAGELFRGQGGQELGDAVARNCTGICSAPRGTRPQVRPARRVAVIGSSPARAMLSSGRGRAPPPPEESNFSETPQLFRIITTFPEESFRPRLNPAPGGSPEVAHDARDEGENRRDGARNPRDGARNRRDETRNRRDGATGARVPPWGAMQRTGQCRPIGAGRGPTWALSTRPGFRSGSKPARSPWAVASGRTPCRGRHRRGPARGRGRGPLNTARAAPPGPAAPCRPRPCTRA